MPPGHFLAGFSGFDMSTESRAQAAGPIQRANGLASTQANLKTRSKDQLAPKSSSYSGLTSFFSAFPSNAENSRSGF
ncbi:hypothetical protein HNR46_003035 [Haloferula luteola]|uniref:Uncharacterized protein n=1 Tax=Haloferula luteola TaxID=595692 RepID=A0A840V3B3_9BACT|nr:hypothetical protein [Haloferula luteola]